MREEELLPKSFKPVFWLVLIAINIRSKDVWKKNWMMQGSSAMHSEGHTMDVPKNSPKKTRCILNDQTKTKKYRFGENRKKHCIKLSGIREVIHKNIILRKL